MYGIKEVLLHADFGAKIDRSKACVIDIPGSVVREIIKTRSDAARDIELGLWHMLAYARRSRSACSPPSRTNRSRRSAVRDARLPPPLPRPPRRPAGPPSSTPSSIPTLHHGATRLRRSEAIPELGLISDSPVMTRKGAEADYDPAKFDARTGVAKLGQVTMKGPNGVPRDEDRWFSIVLIHGRVDGWAIHRRRRGAPPPRDRSRASPPSASRRGSPTARGESPPTRRSLSNRATSSKSRRRSSTPSPRARSTRAMIRWRRRSKPGCSRCPNCPPRPRRRGSSKTPCGS